MILYIENSPMWMESISIFTDINIYRRKWCRLFIDVDITMVMFTLCIKFPVWLSVVLKYNVIVTWYTCHINDNVTKISHVTTNVKLYYVIAHHRVYTYATAHDVIKHINRVFSEDVSTINGVMETFLDCLSRFKRFNPIYTEKKLLG